VFAGTEYNEQTRHRRTNIFTGFLLVANNSKRIWYFI